MKTKQKVPGLRIAKGAKGKFGNVHIPEEAFRPENIRVSISIKIPGDVLDRLRALAAEEGIPYQTYINKLLREATNNTSISERLARIEQALSELR